MRKFFIITAALMLVLTSCGFAQIHIGGNISGVLTDTTYIADDYLRVQSGDTLTIEPGATLLFAGNYQLQIYGLLISAGTEADSIRFMPQVSTPSWGCICFDENSDDNSLLSYCYITGCALGGVNSVGADVTISHCLITGNTGGWGGGIYLNGADVTVSDCEITGNSVTSCGGGIYATHSNPQISDCIVSHNHCGGAGSGYGGGGICFNHSSSGTIIRTLIVENSADSSGGGIAISDFSDAEINNCTIAGNSAASYGGGIEIYHSNPVISNNVITGNTGDSGINFDVTTQVSLEYCDIYNHENDNFTGNVPAGLGGLAMTNFNGDSCDIFSNIFLDPLFENPFNGNFNLTSASPCIDAGNPLSPLDPDGTIADIGAFYFHQMPAPPVIDDLTATIDGINVILYWSPFTAVTAYNIYRSTDPYFDILGMTPLASVTDPEYIDEEVLGQEPFFYTVTTEIE